MPVIDPPANPTNGQYYNGFVWNAANETWDSAYNTQTIPQGRILQVVSTTYSTQVVNLTTSFASSGLGLNIAPINSNSKILVLATSAGIGKWGGYPVNYNQCNLELRRGSTVIGVASLADTEDSSYFLGISHSFQLVDSPNTTSSTNYQVYFRNSAGGKVTINDGQTSSITLIEVSQ